MDVKAKTVSRAVQLLTACGAQFKVLFEDFEYGDLPIAKPEPPRKLRLRKHGYFASSGYKEVCSKMQPGESHVFHWDEAESYVSFCGSVSAYGVKLWGKGNAITARGHDHKTLELLRVA